MVKAVNGENHLYEVAKNISPGKSEVLSAELDVILWRFP